MEEAKKNKTTHTQLDIIFKLQEIKDKGKILREARGRINNLPTERQREELRVTVPQKPCKQEEIKMRYLEK